MEKKLTKAAAKVVEADVDYYLSCPGAQGWWAWASLAYGAWPKDRWDELSHEEKWTLASSMGRVLSEKHTKLVEKRVFLAREQERDAAREATTDGKIDALARKMDEFARAVAKLRGDAD